MTGRQGGTRRLFHRLVIAAAVVIGALVIGVFAYGVLVFVGVGLYVGTLVNPPALNAVYVTNVGTDTWLVRTPEFFNDGAP